MTYEYVDGHEIVLGAVLSNLKILFSFVATGMLEEGSSPPLETFWTFKYLYEEFLMFWHVFYVLGQNYD